MMYEEMAFMGGGFHRTGGDRYDDGKGVFCGFPAKVAAYIEVLFGCRLGCGAFCPAKPDADVALSSFGEAKDKPWAMFSHQCAL